MCLPLAIHLGQEESRCRRRPPRVPCATPWLVGRQVLSFGATTATVMRQVRIHTDCTASVGGRGYRGFSLTGWYVGPVVDMSMWFDVSDRGLCSRAGKTHLLAERERASGGETTVVSSFPFSLSSLSRASSSEVMGLKPCGMLYLPGERALDSARPVVQRLYPPSPRPSPHDDGWTCLQLGMRVSPSPDVSESLGGVKWWVRAWWECSVSCNCFRVGG